MRNMSFFYTHSMIRNRTKTVTRRLGWRFLKPGDKIQACLKCQGLKKGEKVKKLAVIEVVSVRREPLAAITYHDVDAEGFWALTRTGFIKMFCKHMRCSPSDEVTRIEFRYV